MYFNDDLFLDEIKAEIEQNLKDKVFVYKYNYSSRKTQFPMVILSYNSNSSNIGAIDSSRKINYENISLKVEVYAQETNDKTKEENCCYIKNQIINLIDNSKKFKNLFKSYDRNLPNLDTNVCRWQLVYDATINVENNGII